MCRRTDGLAFLIKMTKTTAEALNVVNRGKITTFMKVNACFKTNINNNFDNSFVSGFEPAYKAPRVCQHKSGRFAVHY